MRVEKVGLGYVGADVASGLELRVDRLYESRGEGLSGELSVSRTGSGLVVAPYRFSLTGTPTSRVTLAKYIASRTGAKAELLPMVEEFLLQTLDIHRKGDPVVMVGTLPPRPEPPMVLRHFLHEGANILFGTGGTGKTTLAARAGVSVQTGLPLFPGWDVIKQGPVYILDWEATEDDWNDTIARVCAGLGIKPIEVAYRRCSGPLDRSVEIHARHVAEYGSALMIVDSVTWAMRAGSEGGGIDEPIKRLFDALRQINTCALLIDHMNKVDSRGEPETEASMESRGPKGGQAKTDAARNTFELRRSARNDPDGTMHLALINRKVNRTDKHDPTGIQVRRPSGALVFELEDVPLSDAVTTAAVNVEDRIRAVLRTGSKMTAEEIAVAIDLGSKDPTGDVRKNMTRHPKTFGVEKRSKGGNLYFLIDRVHTGHVPGHVPQGQEDTGTPPTGVSSGMSRPPARRRQSEPDDFGESRWASLIDLNERRNFRDPETANDDG